MCYHCSGFLGCNSCILPGDDPYAPHQLYVPTDIPHGYDYCLNYDCEVVDPNDWSVCTQCRGLRTITTYEFDDEGAEDGTATVYSVYNYLHPELGTCVPDCTCHEGYVNPPGAGTTCLCDEEYSQKADGLCYSCRHLVGQNCFACHSDDGGVSHVCDACENENYFLLADGSGCQGIIDHCDVDQPSGLVTDSNGFESCPRCEYGYFWEESTETCAGYCERCDEEIKGCKKCVDDSTCLDCVEGMFPSYDKSYCMRPIANCENHVSNYDVVDDEFWCSDCKEGYYLNDNGGCSDCSAISGCNKCD